MPRFVTPLLFVIALAVASVAAWRGAWGLLALVVVGGGGYAWYRVQVRRSAEAERFFGDMGEETRLTGFQGGSPSELPSPHTSTPASRPPAPRS